MSSSSTASSRQVVRGAHGMAASTHWLATDAAASVLDRGGNAFDAAVTAGFVLHVVEPHLNGPGGDMVLLFAREGRTPTVLAGQGPAPQGATREHLIAEGLRQMPGAGALAAAVPAAVEAWLQLLRDHGTWELSEILRPAIELAADGFPCSPGQAAVLSTMAEHFREHWSTSADVWLPGGRVPAEGDRVQNPAYARFLRQWTEAARGSDREERIEAALQHWRGPVAEALCATAATSHRHSSATDHRGVITPEDFANAGVVSQRPLSLSFRGVEVHKAGFWSQGPVLLLTLAMLEHIEDERLDLSTALGVHTVTEVLKLALADRDCYFGEGTTPDVAAALLDPQHAARRAGLVAEEASGAFRPSRLAGVPLFEPPLDAADADAAVAGVGEPTVRRSGETRGDTCHVDVVDRHGNIVSATPSGGWLQSSPAVPELGFCLGTRLQMTWLDPSSPSALRPKERPRTTLSPTLLSRAGTVVGALGTPGGDQQDQWQLLYLVRHLVEGLDEQAAIDAPAFHTTHAISSFWPRTWTPRGLVVESRFGSSVIDELIDRGHHARVSAAWSLGRLSTVTRDPVTGVLRGAANTRGGLGRAAGR